MHTCASTLHDVFKVGIHDKYEVRLVGLVLSRKAGPQATASSLT